jgi:ubiquinone/menaquinone biosynthesis C-methylase UbiE
MVEQIASGTVNGLAELTNIRDRASRERPNRIKYEGSLNASTLAKAEAMVPLFPEISHGDRIVDAGSGTGQVTEFVAREFRDATVIAQDLSHELMECAEENRALVHLSYGDAAVQNFPENSIRVKYYSTSGHEIESFGDEGHKMIDAVRSTLIELEPEGRIIIRDFAKPEREGPVYMQIQTDDGFNNVSEASVSGVIDYNLLSKKTLFQRFHQEFRGGNAFEYEIVTINGQEFIRLDAEWAHEFYLRKDYTDNWATEILEKYTYWTPSQAEEILKQTGYVNVHVWDDPNEYILTNRLRGKIGLYVMGGSGNLEQIDFPTTHMLVAGDKPRSSGVAKKDTTIDIAEKTIDYQKLLKTIDYDEEAQIVSIDEKTFSVDPGYKRIIGKKKAVYHLLGDPVLVLKTVRPESINTHNAFKAMLQTVSREKLLDEFQIPHLRIVDKDPEGPPYRWFTQEAVPQGSASAAELIATNKLSEIDIAQMAEYVNAFELRRKWQLDTNPFNWYRVPQADGTTKMVYVDGKIYRYDEAWEFRRVGLLQWLRPEYVSEENVAYSANIPKAHEYVALKEQWNNLDEEHVLWWKKYLSPVLQPQ